jgi:hypothetical protein
MFAHASNWCVRCYRRRIVNVNVNIIVAGLLAMAVTVAAMKGLEHLNTPQWLAKLIGMPWKFWRFNWDDKAVIGVLTTVIDLIADVMVYYVLHWLANHMPRKADKLGHLLDELNPAYAHLTFVQDATMVQMERLILSPLFYIIALGGQHAMLHAGSGLATATAVPFTTAILITRFLHTLWMYYQQKRQLAKIKAGAIVRVADLPPPLAQAAHTPAVPTGTQTQTQQSATSASSHAPEPVEQR